MLNTIWFSYHGFDDPLDHGQEKIPTVESRVHLTHKLHICSPGRDASRPHHLPCCLKKTRMFREIFSVKIFHGQFSFFRVHHVLPNLGLFFFQQVGPEWTLDRPGTYIWENLKWFRRILEKSWQNQMPIKRNGVFKWINTSFNNFTWRIIHVNNPNVSSKEYH